MSIIENIEGAICGASIEVSSLRDVYEALLTEYFALLYKENKTEKEEEYLTKLEKQKSDIEKYVDSIKKEFSSVFISCMGKYNM